MPYSKIFNITNDQIKLKVSAPLKFELPKGKYNQTKEKEVKNKAEQELLSKVELEGNKESIKELFKFKDSLGEFGNTNVPHRGGKQKTYNEEINNEIQLILKGDKNEYVKNTKYDTETYIKKLTYFIDETIKDEAVKTYYENL